MLSQRSEPVLRFREISEILQALRLWLLLCGLAAGIVKHILNNGQVLLSIAAIPELPAGINGANGGNGFYAVVGSSSRNAITARSTNTQNACAAGVYVIKGA